MSSNPNNAVGTNAAYGGRTSVNAFNDIATAYSRGILSGWACAPNSGLTVSLGGDGTNRDVAIAEDNAGNKTSINNISGSPIDVTLSAAPASNSRIDAIVAYVDNPPNGTSTIVDNPGACGIIAVTGTVSASPTPPTENQIRTAITADGASGTTAYYVVLANITVVNGTTDITAGDIVAGSSATLSSSSIDDDSITSDKIDFTTFGDQSTYIQLGQVLICWGQKTWTNNNTGAGGESVSGDIIFPKAYSSAPKVVCQMKDLGGNCGEYCAMSSVTATRFSVWGGHVSATTSTSQTIDWVAIGITSV